MKPDEPCTVVPILGTVRQVRSDKYFDGGGGRLRLRADRRGKTYLRHLPEPIWAGRLTRQRELWS